MDNINKSNWYLERLRCRICGEIKDFCCLEKSKYDYKAFFEVSIKRAMEIGFNIIWCERCKMETVFDFLAFSSGENEELKNGRIRNKSMG